MRQELEIFQNKLKPDLGINWETPILHLIPCMPFAMTIGNSSVNGAGGFSIALKLWWHLSFPDKVIQRMLRFKRDNADDTLISINILKFVMVIINYCAIFHVLKTNLITDDPYPVLLNITDNISALNWTIHTCKCSKLGRLLACFFCSLLINLPLDINSQWISTDGNIIPDDISRIKKEYAIPHILLLITLLLNRRTGS
jgi:hypothetical protein